MQVQTSRLAGEQFAYYVVLNNNMIRNLTYGELSTDLQIRISSILTSEKYAQNNMKIMIYNGDLDLWSNFIGAQRFGQEIAAALKLNTTEDRIWRHNYDSAAFVWMDGGVITSYSSNFHIASIRVSL